MSDQDLLSDVENYRRDFMTEDIVFEIIKGMENPRLWTDLYEALLKTASSRKRAIECLRKMMETHYEQERKRR
jgi:hypothetical protein